MKEIIVEMFRPLKIYYYFLNPSIFFIFFSNCYFRLTHGSFYLSVNIALFYRKVETEGWTAELSQYQDGDNPFGDDAITQPFRWEKKLEKEGMTNIKVCGAFILVDYY